MDNVKLYPNCDNTIWLRSCKEEVIEKINGNIFGEVPHWISGSLLRNGPGLLSFGDDEYGHLFDECSLLHCFTISDGNVTYQCRFLQSDIYKKNKAANRIVMTEFGTKSVLDPCNAIYRRITSIFKPNELLTDNAMISIYPFSDELYAFGESPIIHRINIDTLEVEGKVDMHAKVGVINHTSHPHIDSEGNVYNLGSSIGLTGPLHNIICFPKENGDKSEDMFEKGHIVASIPVRWRFHPSYMHTFGLTENYFIIVQQPLSLSTASLIKCRLINQPLVEALHWYNKENTLIDVISRKTGKRVYSFESAAFFYLHIINQYEKDDTIILDICCYKDPSMIECMYIEALKNMQYNPDYANFFKGRPMRFILPLKLNKACMAFTNSNAKARILDDGRVFVQPEILCDIGCETPQINYRSFLGKEYRYFYAISSDVDLDNPGTVIKVDTETKTCITWCEKNCYPSEPIYVQKPNSIDEDDGVLLSSLVWGGNETNCVGLLILDAKTLSEIGRVKFRTNTPVPKCLHGWFRRKT